MMLTRSVEQQALAGDFGEVGKVHDWRNYISAEVRALWDGFTDAQKLALARQADELAGREEWD
jgi:hypothetical protein